MKKAVAAIIIFSALCVAVFSATVTDAYASNAIESCAECVSVIESTTGRILYEKNGDRRRPMASTTKICTAITVLENCSDVERIVEVPEKAVGVEGSSIYLQKNEKVKIIDLLYGLMLRSGNDCAEALAITVGGSIENFAELMNATAKKAGADGTNFVNPHGLHDDAHYTTANDLAKITAYAFSDSLFARIVSTQKYVMPWEGRDYPRVLVNKNKILTTYEGGDGVKTGFTKKAGRCLVSSATRNGMRVIAVVLNCGPMFEECASLMDRAFSEYAMCDIAKNFDASAEVIVENGKENGVRVRNEDSFFYPLKEEEVPKLKIELTPVEKLVAPVSTGAEAGKFTISLENQLLFEGKLYTIDNVAERDVVDMLKDLIDAW